MRLIMRTAWLCTNCLKSVLKALLLRGISGLAQRRLVALSAAPSRDHPSPGLFRALKRQARARLRRAPAALGRSVASVSGTTRTRRIEGGRL